MKKTFSKLLISALLIGTSAYSSASLAEPRTVPYVDLARYVGDWYQISHVPQFFEGGACACARQRLTASNDGSVRVYNSCNKGNSLGELKDISGIAYNDDPASNAKFTVDFNLPWKGTYWIVGLDANYSYAVVTDRRANSLYILSKANTLASELYQEALNIAKAQLLRVDALETTDHTNCSYPQ